MSLVGWQRLVKSSASWSQILTAVDHLEEGLCITKLATIILTFWCLVCGIVCHLLSSVVYQLYPLQIGMH